MLYRPRAREFQFVLDQVIGAGRLTDTAAFADCAADLRASVLQEAARLAETAFAPANRAGDTNGARLEGGQVVTPPEYRDAYAALADGGWVGMAADPAYGGMGLPQVLCTAMHDMLSGGCLALQLTPLLTQGQIEALEGHADEELKARILPKLISGEWSGTMNLTEPQAGSDLAALRSKAAPLNDGTYAVTGQKIFITWGDSDLVENVCHLVLARLPDAPEGVKGISLFLVPKFLPDESGAWMRANRVSVVSLEEKMGLHGSPTAVMSFDGATGWIVGEPGGGLAAMFTMMNNARLGVGVEGIGIAEAALQAAHDYALSRRQGRPALDPEGTIIDHPNIRWMLASMKVRVFAARALALDCALSGDLGRAGPDPAQAARAALLTPIAKVFGTETGMSVAEDAAQVHGGMGYIEETGISQLYRDVRVTAIYEGTNAIQSIDLVGRKLGDGGAAAYGLIDEIDAVAAMSPDAIATPLAAAAGALRRASDWMLEQPDMTGRLWGSLPYLRGFALVLGARYHAQAALAEGVDGPRGRLAAFYASHILPQAHAELTIATAGAVGVAKDDLDLG